MKTATHHLRRTIIIILTGAAGAVFGLSGTSTAATSQSFQISPPTANYSANPGETVNGKIKVTNLTGDPLALRVGKQNFVAKGEEGEIELVDNANPLYSLAPWFTFDTTTMEVPGRSTKELNYRIAVPTDAQPGGRYGSITFNSIPPRLAPGQSGAAVQQTIAGIAFLRINGAAKEEVSVASFGAAKSFYEKGPVEIITRVKNTGNVHEKATGKLIIKNIFGFKVDEIKLDEHFVIPGAIRKLENTWPEGKKKPFMFGPYTAQLDAVYAGGKPLTATASFTVLPWKQVALALIILIILLIILWRGRKRIRRAGRILTGRE
jgi:hypothetical protein